MFAPTKTWRKWNAKINTNQKRFAVVSALAASALPSLVMARGHRIDNVPEVPLVVPDSFQSLAKTKKALEALKECGADADVEKAKESRKIRAGVGKMRNRRHVQRRGPLVVFAEDHGITQAFRNLPGVELAHVDRLNLLQLAPGGHLGRFIIWTKSAFNRLDSIFGSITRVSTQKKGYTLPRPIMTNPDVTRLINSDEVQSKVRPGNFVLQRYHKKKNPLRNLGVGVKLNPYSMALRRSELLAQETRAAHKAKAIELARAGQAPPTCPKVEAERKHRKRHHARALKNYASISQ
jgi:large subunit ribosomal protein L4e